MPMTQEQWDRNLRDMMDHEIEIMAAMIAAMDRQILKDTPAPPMPITTRVVDLEKQRWCI